MTNDSEANYWIGKARAAREWLLVIRVTVHHDKDSSMLYSRHIIEGSTSTKFWQIQMTNGRMMTPSHTHSLCLKKSSKPVIRSAKTWRWHLFRRLASRSGCTVIVGKNIYHTGIYSNACIWNHRPNLYVTYLFVEFPLASMLWYDALPLDPFWRHFHEGRKKF